MRHLGGIASIEVALVAGRVVRATLGRLLIPPGGTGARLAPRGGRTPARAVAVTTVAPAAQEEHLAAPSTDHETKRLHGSGCDRQKFGGSPSP